MNEKNRYGYAVLNSPDGQRIPVAIWNFAYAKTAGTGCLIHFAGLNEPLRVTETIDGVMEKLLNPITDANQLREILNGKRAA